MAEHGTYAGYQQHRSAGTRPCAECRLAQNAYMRGWRAARRAGKSPRFSGQLPYPASGLGWPRKREEA